MRAIRGQCAKKIKIKTHKCVQYVDAALRFLFCLRWPLYSSFFTHSLRLRFFTHFFFSKQKIVLFEVVTLLSLYSFFTHSSLIHHRHITCRGRAVRAGCMCALQIVKRIVYSLYSYTTDTLLA